MSDRGEKCFIAWGKNHELAQEVGNKISGLKYTSIVGGGQVTDMFLGNQIITQMNQSIHAIILVQGQPNEDNVYNFNDNLMFEWGYLTSRMPPDKIHVFLIDLLVKNLPTDLMGTWATEISRNNRTDSQVAEEIARVFFANASKPLNINKMEILHTWEKTKRLIEDYNHMSGISDVEMAHTLLHSIEASYQYMDDDYAEKILNNMVPISNVLQDVIQIFKVSITLVRITNHLTEPLSFDAFDELVSVCNKDTDYADIDCNLNLWIRFYRYDQLAMLYSSVATNKELSAEEKDAYIKVSIDSCQKALAVLEEISREYPKDRSYAKLFAGYLYGHMRYHCYGEINQVVEARANSELAVAAFKDFYLTYKQLYPGDGYLNNQYAQVYYLDLARHLDYVEKEEEKLMIKRSITSFLAKCTQQEMRQHKVYIKLRQKAGLLNPQKE